METIDNAFVEGEPDHSDFGWRKDATIVTVEVITVHEE